MDEHTLVVGTGGFIGQHLVRALATRGEKIIAISRQPKPCWLGDTVTHIGELTEAGQYAPLLHRCRTVVYLASSSTPGSTAGRPVDEIRLNLLPLASLLQSMQPHPQVGLLYLSSGGCLYASDPQSPATEASTICPSSYHGAAKAAAESIITAWCTQTGGRATLLRPSNVYGPGQVERPGFGIVPTCFGTITRGETLKVWGGGSNVRDYLYIDDLIHLCMAILTTPVPSGPHILNASSGNGISLSELFRAIEMVTGKPLRRDYEVSRAVDAKHIVMDSGKARNRYGWTAVTPLEEGLRKTWDWFNNTQH